MRLIAFLRSPRVQDTALVAVFALVSGLGAVSGFLRGAGHDAWGAVVFGVATLPLLVRRSRPVAATAAVALVNLAAQTGGLTESGNVPLVIALYSLGRYTAGRTTAITAGAVTLAYMGMAVYGFYEPGRPQSAVGPMLSVVIGIALPTIVGQLVRLRAELVERGQQERAEAAVRAERRRIARELHDVVAHHLSVINALVGGARAVLPPEPAAAREALASAEQTARQALAEMRQLLHVLRADDGDGPDAATGVGVERLPALVEQSRNASLQVTGTPRPLPASVDHAVYRVVQEALTNSRKHAPGARAGVRLAYLADAVEVEVLDDGPGAKGGSSGYGLSGMAERVALCGGRLETGSRRHGGFRVYAYLPLEQQ
ncbi:sensor histidine kinase [Thermoactinospora rubra]|uniref:sensor histidine kinase n=1 Tax=Thermoactinospora rubra TaxID=1088767 RepID=UPI00117CD92C|nr:histidine kinase [Thermoactinospora rubra]